MKSVQPNKRGEKRQMGGGGCRQAYIWKGNEKKKRAGNNSGGKNDSESRAGGFGHGPPKKNEAKNIARESTWRNPRTAR